MDRARLGTCELVVPQPALMLPRDRRYMRTQPTGTGRATMVGEGPQRLRKAGLRPNGRRPRRPGQLERPGAQCQR